MARIGAHGSAGLAGGVLAVWVMGRVLTDRHVWSQYVFWVPTEVALGSATALWALAVALAWVGGSKGRHAKWRRRVVAFGLVVAWAYSAVVVWRLPNAMMAGERGTGLRVLNWNVNGVERIEPIVALLERVKPDVAVFVNPHMGVAWHKVYEAFGEPRALVQESGILVVSRVSVGRYGTCWLGVPRAEGDTRARVDPGRAMYLELDAMERVGGPVVAWVVDMPSSWRLRRWETAERAAEAIAGFSGREVRRDEMGNYSTGEGVSGFPRPGLVVGDFNVPRGSGSLRLVTGEGMRSAFDEAGWGRSGTWPRARPWLHLDQAFVGAGLRATRYEVIDAGAGSHRAQVMELVGPGG